MRSFCLPLAVLLIAIGHSNAQSTAATEAATEVTTTAEPKNRILREQYWFDLNGNIELNCSSPVPVDTNGMKFVWRKNGTLVEQVLDLKGRYEVVEGHVFRLTERAHEDDYGDYACEDSAGGELRAWDVRAHVRAYLPDNTNVVEGQKLRLLCKLKGKPYPPVRWTFSNASSAANASGVPVEELGERVETRVGEQGAELVVAAAQRADAGHWGCVPDAPGALGDVTRVRVKDMYAALWPFLGICVEVFVLCAIILVYEKRRTKPEQDDSDTETHDQKKS